MKRGTPIHLELSEADLAAIRAAAYAEGKPIWQFVTDASVGRAKEVLASTDGAWNELVVRPSTFTRDQYDELMAQAPTTTKQEVKG